MVGKVKIGDKLHIIMQGEPQYEDSWEVIE